MVKCMIKQIFCNTQIESVVHIFLPLLPTAYSRCENRGTSIIHQPVRATAPSLHLLTVGRPGSYSEPGSHRRKDGPFLLLLVR